MPQKKADESPHSKGKRALYRTGRPCYVYAMDNPDILFQGQRFRVERAVQTMADGSRHLREVVRHPGAVVILPLLDDGRVCFVRNYRVAVGQTLIELPAGTLEPNEDPAQTPCASWPKRPATGRAAWNT